MPYAGGQVHFREKMRGAVLGTDETIAYWRQAAGLNGTASVKQIPHRGFKGDSSQVTRFTWGSPGGPQIVLFRVDGGGHCEPSIDHRYRKLYTTFCGQQNADLECVQEAWAFFRDKKSSGK
jgi:polyhydroxybutyrate depolymerase